MRTTLVLLLLAASPGLAQQVYSWTDEEGVEHFTDDPSKIPAKARVSRVRSAEAPPPRPPEHQKRAQSPAAVPQREPRPPAVATSSHEREADAVDQDLPERLVHAWRLAVPHLAGKPSGPAFVELAERHTDPKVIAVALSAIHGLYTARTSVTPSRFGADSYRRLPANERVFRVGLKHLDHPDRLVRSLAANVVGLGVARVPPGERLLAAVGARFPIEGDPGVRIALLDVLWMCHCATRAMEDSAIWSVERGDPQTRLHGLTVMGKVGQKGRDFDAEARGRMRRAAQVYLQDSSASIRTAAERAYAANNE